MIAFSATSFYCSKLWLDNSFMKLSYKNVKEYSDTIVSMYNQNVTVIEKLIVNLEQTNDALSKSRIENMKLMANNSNKV